MPNYIVANPCSWAEVHPCLTISIYYIFYNPQCLISYNPQCLISYNPQCLTSYGYYFINCFINYVHLPGVDPIPTHCDCVHGKWKHQLSLGEPTLNWVIFSPSHEQTWPAIPTTIDALGKLGLLRETFPLGPVDVIPFHGHSHRGATGKHTYMHTPSAVK